MTMLVGNYIKTDHNLFFSLTWWSSYFKNKKRHVAMCTFNLDLYNAEINILIKFNEDHIKTVTSKLLTFDLKNGVRWFSGSAFDCRSRGPWSESYTCLMWISLGTNNESPRFHSIKVWIGTLRGQCQYQFDIPAGRRSWQHTKKSKTVKAVGASFERCSPFDVIFFVSTVYHWHFDNTWRRSYKNVTY